MAYSFICRLHCGTSFLRRTLRQKTLLGKKVSSREISSSFPSKYNEKKYVEIRRRLEAVPCLDLLNNELERFQHDLCYENDERLEDLLKWLSKVFAYNIRNCELFVGSIFLKAYCAYGFSETDTTWNHWDSEGWKTAVSLALCAETLGSCLFILDDIVDQSDFRGKMPCWYKNPEVGLSAINDFLLLQSRTFLQLGKYFDESKSYMNIFQEFIQASKQSAYGQCMDTLYTKKHERKYDYFSFETYKTMVDFNASHTVCRFPVHLAMHLAGGYSAEDFEFSEKLCLKLGLYFHGKNDCYDYILTTENPKWEGSDIRKGKITWFSVKFLEVATDYMKKQFVENYGVDDEYAISKVLHLYKETNLLERFQEYQDQFYFEITALIESKDDIKGAFYYHMFHEKQNRKKKW